MILWIIIAGIVVAGGAALLCSRVPRKARPLAMREMSDQLDLEFAEKDNSILDRIKFFKIYHVTTLQAAARNVLRSKNSRPEVCVFDYESIIGTLGNSLTITQTIFYFKDDRMKLPGFRLSPEKAEIMKGKDTVFTYRPIVFPDHPSFSDHYRLVGPEDTEVRELFSSDILEYFAKLKGLWVEGFESELLIYEPKKIVVGKEFHRYYNTAHAIFQVFFNRSTALLAAKMGKT
jgi:hypothetical protein